MNKVAEVDHAASITRWPGRYGHGWMMIGCGVMVTLVLVLIVTDAVGATLLLASAACIAMMAVMMLLMSRTMGG